MPRIEYLENVADSWEDDPRGTGAAVFMDVSTVLLPILTVISAAILLDTGSYLGITIAIVWGLVFANLYILRDVLGLTREQTEGEG